MRLIDADELLEHAYRDRLDSRELIANMINNAPTIKEIPIKVPLDLVVKALEKESCGDCISREAVLDEISKSVDHSLWAYKSLIECVKTLPSVNPQEPKIQFVEKSNFDIKQYNADLQSAYDCGKASQEPKTGHWIDTGNRGYADVDSDNIILYQEMCNRCKCLSYFRKSSGLLIGAKYCPNCGAKLGE